MKQGKQSITLVALLLIAAGVWFWNSRQDPATAGATTLVSNYSPINVDNPAIHWWKLEKSRKTEYKGSGRNPFSAVLPPPPPPPVPKPGDAAYVAPPPPPPPVAEWPANMKFYGYGTLPNGTARRAFLTDGEEVYIVGEGDTLLGRYRILKIGNATLEYEDLSSHLQGQRNLEEAGPGPNPGSGPNQSL